MKISSWLRGIIVLRKFQVIVGFLVGLFSGYMLGLFKVHVLLNHTLPKSVFVPQLFLWLISIKPNTGFLSDAMAVEGVLIGVSIPITLQVVSWAAERYRDQEIAKLFTNEILYKIQYLLFLSNITITIFLIFSDEQNSGLLWVILVWFFINMLIFYKFIKLVEKYTTQTDELFLAKLKGYVQDIFQK